MILRLKSLLNRWRDVNDTAFLTDGDFGDPGFSHDQIRRFVQRPGEISDRISAMGAIFGLSEGELRRDHAAWTQLAETCCTCSDSTACRLIVETGQPATPTDATVCANRRNFTARLDKG